MHLWKELLKTAIHAPSPHNVQPWRVHLLSDTVAELLIEKRRTLPKEDVTGSFIILTMGLFIEAIAILAANHKYKLKYELLQDVSQFTCAAIEQTRTEMLPFASLQLEPDQNEASRFADDLFLTRRTSRISLLPKPVPNEAAQALSLLATQWNQTYTQITEPATIERILQTNIDAVFEDLNVPDYHDEIVEWFRFTDSSSRKTRDGLDYRCMNSSRLSFWLVATFPRLLTRAFTRPILKRTYRKQLGRVPTIGMFAGAFWDPASAFDAGRFLMHAWLEIAKHDLFIHPYGNLVTNQRAAEWYRNETGIADVWLVFKIGYSEQPPTSYRRSLEEVLVD